MNPAEQSMSNIAAAIDVWMRGQSTPVDVLMKITQIVSDYEQERQ